MTYPAIFYHTEAQSGKRYQRRASGRPDIARLIHGHADYWVSPTLPREQKKKKLILADWSAAAWTDLKQMDVQAAIERLIDEGFEIYLWQTGRLVPLAKGELACLANKDIRKAMMPENLEAVGRAAATQQHLSNDEVHVLDNYWVNHLLSGEDAFKPRTLNAHDFHSVPEEKQEQVLRLIKESKPALQSVIIDEFCQKIDDTRDYLCKRFPKETEMPPKYRYVKLDSDHIAAHQVAKPIIQSEVNRSIARPNITMELSEIADVEELDLLDSNYTLSDLQKILRLAPKVRYLNLGSSSVGVDLAFIGLSLPHLEMIKLGMSQITIVGLHALLDGAPKLKYLQIGVCEHICGDIFFVAGSLPNLEVVRFDGDEITTATVESLFAAAPKLKYLNLSSCKSLSSCFTRLPGSLPKLERIDLSKSCVHSDDLRTLLKAAPNLKALNISACDNISSDFIFDPESLLLLEEVTLKSDTTAASLKTLLAAAPRLKKINLSSSSTISDDLTLAPGSLPYLEEINLSTSVITKKGLQALLTAAPNLKVINLDSCEYFCISMLSYLDTSDSDDDTFEPTLPLPLEEGAIEFRPEFTPHVEKIDLRNCRISVGSLKTLLISSPNLKYIYLESVNGLPTELILPLKMKLPLEEISLDGSLIKSTELQAVLACTPKLRKLGLARCMGIHGSTKLERGSLPFLEDICLDYSDITSAGLKALIEAAPNLKYLSLRSCNRLTADPILAQGSLPQLHTILFNGSNISTSTLNVLLATAPKLKKLSFDYCKNISSNTKFISGSLPYLEKVDLDGTYLTDASIKSLLAAAPKLKEENISRVRPPTDDSFLNQMWQSMFSGRSSAGAASSTPKFRSSTHSQSLDANTDPGITPVYKLKRIFYPLGHSPVPDIRLYRLDVFQKAITNTKNCSIEDAFSMQKEGDLGLQSRKTLKSATETIKKKAGGHLFFGKQTLDVTKEWQALASLSPHEEILRYNVSPAVEVEIKYSTRDNLYYIRGKKEETVDIDFTLHVPDAQPVLPATIQSIVNKFLKYRPGALTLDKEKPDYTGEDYLNAILSQEKGACRHRAFAFKVLMAREHPKTPVRIISNGCHAFVEVKVGAQWLRCDLGGYPAKLEINEDNDPKKAPHVAAITQTEIHVPTPAAHVPELSTTTDYEYALRTWDTKKSLTGTPKEYYQQCVGLGVKKRLIECTTAIDADALHYALQAHCRSISRPIFYVNSPDDLICSAPYMHRNEDNTGELRRGPGGRLHDFLSTNKEGVVVVNYGAFKADDLVRFNTLIDEKRKADDTDVPVDMVVIGLLNLDNPTAIPGADFYSRFDLVETCPVDGQRLTETMPKLPTIPVIPSGSEGPPECGTVRGFGMTEVINLCHALDWEERLMGRWVPDRGTWHYEKGELQSAIASGATSIEIQNGLWENKDFCRFWREASQSGMFRYAGGSIAFPETLTIVHSDGYDWTTLTPLFQQELTLSDASYVVLNPASFGSFFSQYQVIEGKQLQCMDGLVRSVKTNEPPALHVHITRTLCDDQWAMLLEECKKEKVKLVGCCVPGIELPKALQIAGMDKPASLESTPWPTAEALLTTSVIQSTDVDTTVAILARDNPDNIVIDVSECHDSDLLMRTNGALINKKDEPLHFEFSETICAVSTALVAGKTVILKGRCSIELADELAPFLLKRSKEATPLGKLIIASDNTAAFNYMPQYKHAVSIEKKHTDESGWAGLYSLPDAIKDPGVLLDTVASEAQAAEFMNSRVDKVKAILAREPYLFLTGLTGVGKSMFVTHELCRLTDVLYQGESDLLLWAKDKASDKPKLLFIDEANLSTNEWSAFEGLFNQPPGILIDGQYYQLTPAHKVIFAGNPLSYGDERKLAPLFERHGNALVFEPLPSTVLYERILKPVFAGTPLESKVAELSAQLLQVYRFLSLCSEADILISPRELQMMALLTVSHCKENGDDAEAVAKYFSYHLAKHLVPKEKQDEFKRLFEPTVSITYKAKSSSTDFLITPSREQISDLLDEFLALREIRHESPDNEARLYGGLGGIILDGEPGIGKSELVTMALRARGYEEMRNLNEVVTGPKSFYRMPASMSLAEKETLLLKAFNEGSVVVIDEINSSPMMERLLNALLMGTTLKGKPPEHPGFMVIGTQNPITMPGRRAPSTALARRMTTVEIPPYNNSETRDILLAKGVPSDKANDLVKAYQTQVEYARQHHLQPAPTFRDLLKIEKQIIRGRQAVTSEVPTEIRVSNSASDLMKKYFDLDGVFDDYLTERSQTYWFRDLCSNWASLVLGCFGYKTESALRRDYISELQAAAMIYQEEPSGDHYAGLKGAIEKCKQKSLPRAEKGPESQRSLRAKLNLFQQELGTLYELTSVQQPVPVHVSEKDNSIKINGV